MSDIELVIKMSKEKYDTIKSDLYNTFSAEMKEWGLEAIRSGAPLPKGHGRLGDLNALAYKMCMADIDDLESEEVAGLMLWFCDKAQTIIEADKERE